MNRPAPAIPAAQWLARFWIACLGIAALVGPGPANAEEPAPTHAQAKYELRFMTDMIDHHAMAIIMAEHCLNRAVHPELNALCEQIITAQSQEIQQMSTWLQDWYGIAYTPQPHEGMTGMMQKMESMTAAEFEVYFMRTMIRHHYRAVVAGVQCLDRAFHPELLQTCANIVVTQTAEIQQMQAWLCEWYARCHVGPRQHEEE